MQHPIILASTSPRRRELLKKIVKDFRVVKSGVDESRIKAPTPIAFAKKAAQLKARAVAQKHPDSIVIAADTIVLLGKRILGKPKDKQEAISMLRNLAGKTHQVITALAVIFPGKKMISDTSVTSVKTKKISDQEIIDYVATGQPLDKAGAYGIQEIEEIFIERIKGDYDNVVGLPVYKLKKILDQFI
jgi:septum formation protein